MPSLNALETYQGANFGDGEPGTATLEKRIAIEINGTSTAGQIAASRQDPWAKSSKYALGWVYFSLILLTLTALVRLYHLWGDKIRTALHKEKLTKTKKSVIPVPEYSVFDPPTSNSTRAFFPKNDPLPKQTPRESSVTDISAINNFVAFVRWISYRPVPVIKIWKVEIVPPSLGAIFIVFAAFVFVTLYCFIPRPLFYPKIQDGSPPLAIRAGMIAVALMPWIVSLSMKANPISMATGLGHERLNVLHRWGGYLCLFLGLVHMIPFYITPIWENDESLTLFGSFIIPNTYIYGTGIAAFIPLAFLCIHSLPIFRNRMYELFVALHIPVSMVFLAMMFWHCKNFLTSWHYLIATVGIWFTSYLVRLFYLNWTDPYRLSWLIGEESAVTILPENAVKVTIPTEKRWRPGQYVYLRMPGISIFGNHPFTIASLCSDDFPSNYGEEYRDMALVFRPFSGFTAKVLEAARQKGPYKTYRAFVDGPYGGMRRDMSSFDHVIFFAGGSGITAIASQLLDLIRRMRDGKALTRTVRVVWALKRPETMEWFKEELRICREYAPPGSVLCQFHLTAAKSYKADQQCHIQSDSDLLYDKLSDKPRNVAYKEYPPRFNKGSAANQNPARENEDRITAIPPPAHVPPPRIGDWRKEDTLNPTNPYYYNSKNVYGQRLDPSPKINLPSTTSMSIQQQKNFMRFAFGSTQKRDGWRVEHERPDIPHLLKEFSKDFGRRTCVFVCGPPSMRIDVSNTVASMQRYVMADPNKQELFLHAENYAL